MDVQTFLAEFGHIASAPKGVVRLREMILALAVKGQLVPQNHSEEPAEVQLQRIRKKASSTQIQGRKRQARRLVSGTKAAPSENIPLGWGRAHLCDLVRVLNGRAYSKAELLDRGTPVLRVGNLFTSDKWYYSDLELDDDKYCDANDLLYAWSASFGPFIWNGGRSIYHYHIWKLDFFSHDDLNKHFLYTWLLEKTREIKASGHGISMVHMTKEKFERLVVNLPPINEQARIVSKVQELMALCDRLEKQHNERHRMQGGLRASVIAPLSRSRESDELRVSWLRINENFGHLVSAPEDVEHLNAEIKNMAVQGLLISPSAERTDLEEIRRSCLTLRAHYQKQGLMRKQKLVSMADHDATYPAHWPVVAFDEVAVVIGGVTKGRDLRNKEVVTCPYLSVANVQRGSFRLDRLKTIQIQADELKKYKVDVGDILITEGGDWDKVGRTAIWQGAIDNCLHQNHIFKARVPSDLLINEWVELVFNSFIGRRYFAGASKQTTNLASINMTQLRSFPFPIPPVQEQRAILRQVSLLTARCLDWQRQLRRKQHLGEAFAQAAIASLTGVSVIDEDDVVKAPQTELVAPLCLGATPDVKELAPLATILARHHGEMSAKDLWQRFGGEIDAFYAQLKTEVANGWIREPAIAEMREVPQAQASA